MSEREYLQCQHFNCLLDKGLINQSIPIVLAVSSEDKKLVEGKLINFQTADKSWQIIKTSWSDSGQSAMTLCYEGKAVAILRHPEFYEHRKEERVARQFGTTSKNHPYIRVHIDS